MPNTLPPEMLNTAAQMAVYFFTAVAGVISVLFAARA
jgi:hypothetical protein